MSISGQDAKGNKAEPQSVKNVRFVGKAPSRPAGVP